MPDKNLIIAEIDTGGASAMVLPRQPYSSAHRARDWDRSLLTALLLCLFLGNLAKTVGDAVKSTGA